MAGLSVDGYGLITQSNAKDIYKAWRKGEVDLNTSQQKILERYISPAEMEEISYEVEDKKQKGADQIDTSNTKEKANVAGMAAGVTVSAAFATIVTGKVLSNINGFSALACAIIAGVSSAATLALSFLFDKGELENRNSQSDNAENTNSTLDNYTNGLVNSMDMMNEDVELYQEQQDQLTQTVNEQTSQGADLQMQYDTAVAMGDTEGAKSIKEKMKKLSETDNSGMEEALEETGAGIEEYRAMNEESLGVSESGQTVASFLKEGKGQGVLAMAEGALCLAAAVFAAQAAGLSLIPKIWVLGAPIDAIPGTAGSILWAGCGLSLGMSAKNFMQKGNEELECANNGEAMQEHVDQLNDMLPQQEEFINSTEESYAESDEKAEESKAEAEDKAKEATGKNKGLAGKKVGGGDDKDKDKEKEPAPAAKAA